MFTQIKYLYSEADQFGKPIISQAMPKSVFLAHIREGVETLYIRTRTMLANHRMYSNILEHYLNKYEINDVIPNETFIQEMWDRLKESGEFEARNHEWGTRKKVPRFTRKLINEWFSPKGLVQRKLLKEIAIGRYERYFQLSKNSQDAISWFEQNGKRVEAMAVYIQRGEADIDPNNEVMKTIHRISNRELLPLTKNGKIEHAIRFLEYVNLRGFEEATNEHVQKFEEVCRQRGIKQTQDYLAHVATFFINIHSKGFIKRNPFANVSLKMDGGAVKKDFIPVEGIAKIRDLSTLDKTNKDDVRDRLFAVLAYDLALRIGELLSLKVSDFRKDEEGEWFVMIRPEVQKGHKDEDMMYFFFEETKELLELYINKLREQYKPTTDHLIVSNQWGRGLSSQPCASRFREFCSKQGIKTYYGKNPSPHLLRHSFATLNIEPLGLSLPLYELIQRLRHERVETTRKHYIHNNPYLKKMKHEVYRKKAKKKSPSEVLDEIPLADIEHWLSAMLEVDAGTIKRFRHYHKKVFDKESKVDKYASVNTIFTSKVFISEEDTSERLLNLKVSPYALRQYALKNNALAEDYSGTLRYGSGFRYREDFIEDLVSHWISAEELQKRLKLKATQFWEYIKDREMRTLNLGNSTFFYKLDVLK